MQASSNITQSVTVPGHFPLQPLVSALTDETLTSEKKFEVIAKTFCVAGKAFSDLHTKGEKTKSELEKTNAEVYFLKKNLKKKNEEIDDLKEKVTALNDEVQEFKDEKTREVVDEAIRDHQRRAFGCIVGGAVSIPSGMVGSCAALGLTILCPPMAPFTVPAFFLSSAAGGGVCAEFMNASTQEQFFADNLKKLKESKYFEKLDLSPREIKAKIHEMKQNYNSELRKSS